MLTQMQIDARAGKLTASRMAPLMKGDAAAIMQLYLEMIGEAAEENLDHVWPVRLGSATEQLNLDWYEMKNGPITRRGEVVVHAQHPWAAATLDGWHDELGCCIEVKHVGGREPLEVVIERYQPQMQWQMEVTGATLCALSVIMGANEPVVEYPLDRDGTIMQPRWSGAASNSWDCVAARRAPVALEPVAAPIDASKVYDMTSNNLWAVSAVDWLANKAAAAACKRR